MNQPTNFKSDSKHLFFNYNRKNITCSHRCATVRTAAEAAAAFGSVQPGLAMLKAH